jgi:methylated-DNA-[protein]-cysteine S-methyltransferase
MEEYYSAFCASPVGLLQVKATESAIKEVQFFSAENKKIPLPPNSPPVIKQCITELDEYFAGTRTVFEVSLAPDGTPFQQQVWETLLQIGFGKQSSYLLQSKKLGNVKAIRAMASANGKNPIAIIIPCHRVIGSNQTLVGYAGGLWRKKWLLEHEAKLYSGVQTLF